MMQPKDLLVAALRLLRHLDEFGPLERAEVLHIATSIVQVEVARLNRPQPVRDE